ncbi:hypothetical protein JTF08_03265 [Micrococcaceae bacterium RIT802]|nr:hypothetical protein [Micrococcaceae bacterium RIT 802]
MTIEDDGKPEVASTTATEIATWLLNKIEQVAPHSFPQAQAAVYIRNTYGTEWSYKNANGNWAINTAILKEFRKIKYPRIQWERGVQAWRLVTEDQLENILEREAKAKRRKEEIARRKAEKSLGS